MTLDATAKLDEIPTRAHIEELIKERVKAADKKHQSLIYEGVEGTLLDALKTTVKDLPNTDDKGDLYN